MRSAFMSLEQIPTIQEQDPITEDDFAEKKRHFFVRLGLKYRDYLSFHKKSGQIERNAKFGKEKYTDSQDNEQEHSKRWGNPTEHCLIEAAIAEIIAEILGLSETDKKTLIIAALLHDWRKRGEIEETKGETDPKKIEESYEKSKRMLLESGIENVETLVRLAESVAHTSLNTFAALQPDNSIAPLEDLPDLEMIMHYIDDITRGTNIVSLDERMDYLDQAAEERYPFNEKGKAIWGGRTFFQAQREIGRLIEQKLAEKAGFEEQKDLPNILKQRLLERISES